MAYGRRKTYTRRRASASRSGAYRRSYSASRGRRTARRASRSYGGRARQQTVRIVLDTGALSGASLGPSGMVKPAPRPRQARF